MVGKLATISATEVPEVTVSPATLHLPPKFSMASSDLEGGLAVADPSLQTR